MSNATLNILVRARSLIEHEASWCHGYSGNHDEICAVHALQRARAQLNYHSDEEIPAYEALAIGMGLSNCVTGPQMGNWNDTHTHAEVLAAFDRSIAALTPTDQTTVKREGP